MATLWNFIALAGFFVFAAFSMWLLLTITLRVWARPARRGVRARKSKASHNPGCVTPPASDRQVVGKPF